VKRTQSFLLIGLLLFLVSWPSFGKGLMTCKELGAVSQDTGWSAHGRFSNDDYGFSVHIPDGFTAWSGAAKEAPFHGIGFSLDRVSRSCINLYLGWRVDADEAPPLPSALTSISMAGATAGVAETRGKVHGTPYLNRTVYFTSKRGEGLVDGRVTLVVPARDERPARELFDAFVGSLRFP
jgi:hypothetical protein